jgi:hypothetical protein
MKGRVIDTTGAAQANERALIEPKFAAYFIYWVTSKSVLDYFYGG